MRRVVFIFSVLVLSLTASLVFAGSAELQLADPAMQARINENYGKIPLAFEINKGQTDSQVDFISRGAGYSLFLSPTEAVISFTASRPEKPDNETDTFGEQRPRDSVGVSSALGRALRMKLDGSNPLATVFGEETRQGISNYFVGNKPEQWRVQVAHYGKVRYKQIYDGIDLVYYGNQRKLEYDFIIQPGADYKQIRLNIQGADKVSIDEQGNLVLRMKAGDVIQHKPVVYQTENTINRGDAEKTNFPLSQRRQEGFTPTGKYIILAGNNSPLAGEGGGEGDVQVGFQVEGYDPSIPLVIDPVFSYSTYFGGSGDDGGQGIAVDSSGNAYITGNTTSTNFPATAGAHQTTNGGSTDAFVTKLNSTGTALIYSTFLGGSSDDGGLRIAVDTSGNAYVTGFTLSSNFPTTAGSYQTVMGGSGDVFVTKLNSAGAVAYSSYLAGSGYDWGNAIAVDTSGNAYIAGYTASTNFPITAGAYQTAYGGGYYDAFVTKLNPTGTALIYSTYVGGNSYDYGNAIAVDSSGNIYIAGFTSSANFPATAGAYQTAYGGGTSDAFVAKLNSTGTALTYSTLVGDNSLARGIAVDSSGNAYITGYTYSASFPATASAYQTAYGGGTSDAFVTKLNPSGATLVYSTYIGGSGNDIGNGIAIDSYGNAYIAGATSVNFPTTAGAYQSAFGGGLTDAFVAQLNATGTALAYSTYLGGASNDGGVSIALDSSGNAYITGNTISINFPTTASPYQNAYGGGAFGDAFVAKINFSYSGTYSGAGVTINLAQSVATLSGAFSAGTINGNMGGFVDSSGQAYVWAWWDNPSLGSGVLAGNLSASGNQAIFNFGGGQGTSGRFGQTVLSGMTQGSLSGSTTTSSSSTSSANFSGTYTAAGLTVILTQTSTTLSGTFNAGGLTGNMGGVIDSSGQAYMWAWYDTGAASAALAGNLSVSGNQATLSFGGGQSSIGGIGPLVLSGMTRSQ